MPVILEAHTCKKRFPALRDHPDLRIGKQTANRRHSPAALPWVCGEERHELGQNLIGCASHRAGEDIIEGDGIRRFNRSR